MTKMSLFRRCSGEDKVHDTEETVQGNKKI